MENEEKGSVRFSFEKGKRNEEQSLPADDNIAPPRQSSSPSSSLKQDDSQRVYEKVYSEWQSTARFQRPLASLVSSSLVSSIAPKSHKPIKNIFDRLHHSAAASTQRKQELFLKYQNEREEQLLQHKGQIGRLGRLGRSVDGVHLSSFVSSSSPEELYDRLMNWKENRDEKVENLRHELQRAKEDVDTGNK